MDTHKKDIDVKTNIFLLENFKYIAKTRDMNIKIAPQATASKLREM